MKKIISLVVVATMLFTLFAVNVSAAVPTSYKDFVTNEDFAGDDIAGGWTTVVGYKDAAGTAAINNEALTLTLTQKGDKTSFLNPAILTFSGETYYNNKPDADTVVEFDVTADDNKSALLLVVRGTSTKLYELIMGAAGFEKGHTYHYVVKGMAQDGMASSGSGLSVYRRDITTDGKWLLCSYKSGYDSNAGISVANGGFRSIMPDTSYAINDGRGALLSFGIGGYEVFSTDGQSDPTGACYTIDNVEVYKNKNYVSTGLIASQDFEDPANTRLSEDHGGNAKTYTLKTDANGNTYGVFTGWTGLNDTNGDAAKAEKFGITRGGWSLTFDLYLTAEMAFSIYDLERSDDINLMLDSGDIPAGKWVTCKANHFAVPDGLTGWEYVFMYKEKGSQDAWTKINRASNLNTPTGAVAFVFAGTGSTEYYLDNVVLSENEFFSLPGVAKEDNTLNVGVAYEEVYVNRLSTVTNMVPVLATFKDNVLVGVDFRNIAHDAGYVEAELSADATGADRAELYIWRSFDTLAPEMEEAYDLSSYLQ